ncbi:hypothetical protein CASFOL_019667 [Castilleja foliolosa]|uniref:Uncharacterized protein n=1 Tax=Castilleja foliolosa TaxID=1961234 RepID=A0ABD3CYP1_9LAMI
MENPKRLRMCIGGDTDSYLCRLTFIKIRARKSVGDFDSLPYVVTFISAGLWLYYGILDHGVAIIIVNAFGVVLETLTVKKLAVGVVILLLTIPVTLVTTHSFFRVEIVGWTCTALSVLVVVSPIFDIVRVVKTRDVQYMSFWLSLALALNGAAWTAYGVDEDNYCVIPNGFGCALGVIQILIYVDPKRLTFIKIRARKSVGDFDSLPYVVTFTSAGLWLYYGILDHGVAIIIVNAFGVVLEALYITMYMYYASNDIQTLTVKKLAVGVVILLLTIPVTLVTTHSFFRVEIVGWTCTALSILVAVSPIFDIVRVAKTRDVQYMSFWLSLALALNGAAWTAYGVDEDNYCVDRKYCKGLMMESIMDQQEIMEQISRGTFGAAILVNLNHYLERRKFEFLQEKISLTNGTLPEIDSSRVLKKIRLTRQTERCWRSAKQEGCYVYIDTGYCISVWVVTLFK